MADIHIAKSPYNKRKGMVRANIYFHVPNDHVNNSYPGLPEVLDTAGNPIPVSSVPGVTVDELTALKNGSLCEVFVSRLFDLSSGVNTIKTFIQEMWQEIANDKQAELNKEYPFYGVELARSA
jgi:hypothetical protein